MKPGPLWAETPPARLGRALACALLSVCAFGAPTAFAVTDGEITRRLNTAYDTAEGLDKVDAKVVHGAVRLTGVVLSSSDSERAVALAEEMEGVTVVSDELRVERGVSARLGPVVSRLRQNLYDFLAFLPLVAVAALVLVVFWGLSRLLKKPTRIYNRVAGNSLLGELLARLVSVSFLVIGVLMALEILDATALVSAVLGTAGVAGLAVGFAFRDIMENYVAGVLLSVRQPFAPSDVVKIGPDTGTVIRLTSRATILMTEEGNHLRIPNATVFKETILNYTRNPERRFDFGVGVGMQENLVDVRELGAKILGDMEGVLAKPEPTSRIEPLGDFSVTIRFYAWVDQAHHDFFKVRSEAIRLVKRAFDHAEIEMPEPIQRLRIEEAPGPNTETQPSGASTETAEATDVSRDAELDRRIEEERAEEEDLLNKEAPKE